MAGQTRRTRGPSPSSWGIRSVSVRARDGPQRLDRIYRLLVMDPEYPAAPHGPPAPEAGLEEQEEAHARRHLRPRVD